MNRKASKSIPSFTVVKVDKNNGLEWEYFLFYPTKEEAEAEAKKRQAETTKPGVEWIVRER